MSAANQAYDRIRSMILRGDLSAGDILVPEELAGACGISRTPVRDALFRLESEMFVARLDNKRTVVRSWTMDEIAVFVELRVRIGGLVAARAAREISPAELDTLRALNLELAILNGPQSVIRDALAVTGKFYEVLIEATRSDRLARISNQLVNPAPLIRFMERYARQPVDVMLRAHQDLVEALAAGDESLAEVVMIAFIRRTYNPAILARLKHELAA